MAGVSGTSFATNHRLPREPSRSCDGGPAGMLNHHRPARADTIVVGVEDRFAAIRRQKDRATAFDLSLMLADHKNMCFADCSSDQANRMPAMPEAVARP